MYGTRYYCNQSKYTTNVVETTKWFDTLETLFTSDLDNLYLTTVLKRIKEMTPKREASSRLMKFKTALTQKIIKKWFRQILQ